MASAAKYRKRENRFVAKLVRDGDRLLEESARNQDVRTLWLLLPMPPHV
jgi:hypothetical protein